MALSLLSQSVTIEASEAITLTILKKPGVICQQRKSWRCGSCGLKVGVPCAVSYNLFIYFIEVLLFSLVHSSVRFCWGFFFFIN